MADQISLKKTLKILLNIGTVIFSILLIADILSGFEVSEEIVEHKLNTVRSSGGLRHSRSVSVIGFETNVNTYVLKEPSIFINVGKGDTIRLYKTKIFGEVGKIEHQRQVYKDAAFTVYALNYLFPVICIISSFGALFFIRSRLPVFDLILMVSVFMTGFIIISMITNNIF
jgi:hypothetical protein